MCFSYLRYFVCCSIREVTAEVGAAVLRAAVEEDLADGRDDVGPRELAHMSKVWKTFILYIILIFLSIVIKVLKYMELVAFKLNGLLTPVKKILASTFNALEIVKIEIQKSSIWIEKKHLKSKHAL